MARELTQVIGNDGQTYELRDKKLADASVVTSVPSGSSVMITDSNGNVSKITTDNFKNSVGGGTITNENDFPDAIIGNQVFTKTSKVSKIVIPAVNCFIYIMDVSTKTVGGGYLIQLQAIIGSIPSSNPSMRRSYNGVGGGSESDGETLEYNSDYIYDKSAGTITIILDRIFPSASKQPLLVVGPAGSGGNAFKVKDINNGILTYINS